MMKLSSPWKKNLHIGHLVKLLLATTARQIKSINRRRHERLPHFCRRLYSNWKNQIMPKTPFWKSQKIQQLNKTSVRSEKIQFPGCAGIRKVEFCATHPAGNVWPLPVCVGLWCTKQFCLYFLLSCPQTVAVPHVTNPGIPVAALL